MEEELNDRKRKREDKPDDKKSRETTNASSSKKAPGVGGVKFMTKAERIKQEQNEVRKEEKIGRDKEKEHYQRRRDFLLEDDHRRERERQLEREHRERERQRVNRERQAETERLAQQKEQSAISQEKLKKTSALAGMELLDIKEIEPRARQVDKEIANIRKEYLGLAKEVKKMQKPSEKFRNIFNFEWDATEDTLRGDLNPLYQNRVEPQLLFGRGYRAGIDVREQRKVNNFYERLVEKRVESGEEMGAFIMPSKESHSVKIRDLETNEDEANKKHWTDKALSEMTTRDWRIFREDYEIYIKGGRVPQPMRNWNEGPLSQELLDAVRKVGYTKPMPIQMQAIPIACEMRDLIGVAQTGSGKTAAFMLPMLQYIKTLPPINEVTAADGPYAVILAPSRELALQIDEEFKKFAMFSKCRVVSVVGGRNEGAQGFELRRGVELIIGTPGRVAGALDKAYTVLHQCNYVILDEADKMIDQGFEEYINRILLAIPQTNLKSENEDEVLKQELEAKAGHRNYRITQMFTATMPSTVERLARKYLRCPCFISIGDPGAGKKSIEQRIEFINEADKKRRLEEILNDAPPPIIVFVNQKKAADYLAKSLETQGHCTTVLHSGKSQEAREANMANFKQGKYDILVATDLAGRGIDVEGVKQVINFDMPKSIEAYTHRIGRTGRAGMKGLASSFVTKDDHNLFYDLRQFLQSVNQIVPMEIERHPSSKIKPGSIDQKGPKVIFAS